jgi:hypothetical protein
MLSKRITNIILPVMLFLNISSTYAQQKNVPLHRFATQEVERILLADSAIHQTAVKPFLESRVPMDRVVGFAKDDTLKTYYDISKLILKSHLVTIQGDNYKLILDPLFDLSFAYDFKDTSHYAKSNNLISSTRGFQAMGDLGEKFCFQTGFYETQTYLPSYLKSYVDSTGVAPGFGRVKAHNVVAFDYAMAYGNISYSPSSWLNLQFGTGKHFIGHGYRSILLSDAAFNYPFIKASTSFFNNKLQYTTIYASLQTQSRLPLGEVPESLFKRKSASFHYLSWAPHKRIAIGLFEGIIWKRYDNEKGSVAQPYGAYIPVVGVNTAIHGLNSVDNVMLGANLKIQTNNHSYVYGQLAIDDLAKSSLGYQVGFKYFDLITPRLDVQVEWNQLDDWLYSSRNPIQNYVHVNQPLGHPTGAATQEILGIVDYRWRRIIGQLKYNQIYHSTGPEGDWRNHHSKFESTENAAPKHYTQQIDLNVGVLINPKWNCLFKIGYLNRLDQIKRQELGNSERRTSMMYLSLSTNLINQYRDF